MAKKTKRPASKRSPSKAKKAAKSTSRKTAGAAMSPKHQFLNRYGIEHETTLRVLRAIPSEQGDFRPHPRSQSCTDLIYTMLYEQELGRRALSDGPIMGSGGPPPKPSNLEEGIEMLDKGYRAIAEEIRKASPAKLGRTVQFPVAKGQMGDWSALDFIWFMLFDHIHHRGQMSVYVRMAGGKVPSIYGPSADDPWT